MLKNQHSINIVTPIDLLSQLREKEENFTYRLDYILKNLNISCLRIRTLGIAENNIIEIVKILRKINGNRVPILLENNIELVKKLGLSGVHLTDGSQSVGAARKALGQNLIVGAFCGLSKHYGLVAAEHSADYISFSSKSENSNSDNKMIELFHWWSDFIEIPLMAECLNQLKIPTTIKKYCDFLTISEEIFFTKDPIEKFI